MAARTAITWLAAIALTVALAGRAAADDGYQVIVHPDNPIVEIDAGFLRNAYLKKIVDWTNGSTIHPIDLSPRFPARERFTRGVLRKTPAQLRNYWNQRIFSGKGVPPHAADSVAAVIAFVLANPGAIGYLPADADPGRAKVIEVR